MHEMNNQNNKGIKGMPVFYFGFLFFFHAVKETYNLPGLAGGDGLGTKK